MRCSFFSTWEGAKQFIFIDLNHKYHRCKDMFWTKSLLIQQPTTLHLEKICNQSCIQGMVMLTLPYNRWWKPGYWMSLDARSYPGFPSMTTQTSSAAVLPRVWCRRWAFRCPCHTSGTKTPHRTRTSGAWRRATWGELGPPKLSEWNWIHTWSILKNDNQIIIYGIE